MSYCVSDCPEIFHDEPLMDRKSVFQAHFANVTEVSQVNAVMRKLLTNKKIADATHNIQVGMNETFSFNTMPSTVTKQITVIIIAMLDIKNVRKCAHSMNCTLLYLCERLHSSCIDSLCCFTLWKY